MVMRSCFIREEYIANEIGGVEVLTETEKEKLDKCIGKTVNEIETPALIVDLDIMERNMDKMMRFLSKGTVGIRPHAKTHKTPPIARMQVEKGAIGITCATIGEAEVLVDGGIKDVLVTNRIVGTGKVMRATSLAKKATLRVSVDSMENVKELALAAQDQGVIIGIVVEVDIGNKRSVSGLKMRQWILPGLQNYLRICDTTELWDMKATVFS